MTVLLTRHAEAGDRWAWRGDDRDRPLSPIGQRQAVELVDRLATTPVSRVITSPYVRCVQTVEPLADALGLPVARDDALAEGAGAAVVLDLLDEPGTEIAVACTHGDVIADVLAALERRGVDLGGAPRIRKASIWRLTSSVDGVEATYHAPAGPR